MRRRTGLLRALAYAIKLTGLQEKEPGRSRARKWVMVGCLQEDDREALLLWLINR